MWYVLNLLYNISLFCYLFLNSECLREVIGRREVEEDTEESLPFLKFQMVVFATKMRLIQDFLSQNLGPFGLLLDYDWF